MISTTLRKLQLVHLSPSSGTNSIILIEILCAHNTIFIKAFHKSVVTVVSATQWIQLLLISFPQQLHVTDSYTSNIIINIFYQCQCYSRLLPQTYLQCAWTSLTVIIMLCKLTQLYIALIRSYYSPNLYCFVSMLSFLVTSSVLQLL